jgi:hypothetical protein
MTEPNLRRLKRAVVLRTTTTTKPPLTLAQLVK